MPELSQHPKTYKNKDMEKYLMKRRIADKLNREARQAKVEQIADNMIDLIRLVGHLEPYENDPNRVTDFDKLKKAAQKVAYTYNLQNPGIDEKYKKRHDLKDEHDHHHHD